MPGITFQKCYVFDGKAFPSLPESKIAALNKLWESLDGNMVDTPKMWSAQELVDHSASIMDILSTTDKSRPLARKSNGGRKKRTPRAPEAPPKDLGIPKEY